MGVGEEFSLNLGNLGAGELQVQKFQVKGKNLVNIETSMWRTVCFSLEKLTLDKVIFEAIKLWSLDQQNLSDFSFFR